jgi:hypothetical protein
VQIISFVEKRVLEHKSVLSKDQSVLRTFATKTTIMSRQMVPKTRRRKIRRLTKTVAQMIVDARAYFDREATEQKWLLLAQPVKRTAKCLDVTETLVKKACKVVESGDALPSDDEPETRERQRAVPDTLYPTIRATMFAMFRAKEPVSLDTLLAKLQELHVTRFSGWVWSRATLHRVLTAELPFRFDKRLSHYQGMKEKQSVALQRLHYIRAVWRYREEGGRFSIRMKPG